MTVRLYNVSYTVKYFGVVSISVSKVCKLLMTAALLCFLHTRTEGHDKWILLVLAVLDAVGVVVYLTYFSVFLEFGSIEYFLTCQLPELFSVVVLMGILISGWLYLRKTGRFYRWFVPFATLGVLPFLAFTVYQTFIAYRRSNPLAMSSFLGDNLSRVMLGVSVLIVAVQFIRDEIRRFSERQLMMEMGEMAQLRYENLRLHNEEIMMLRHDMDKHYHYLRAIASDDETAQYLDALISQTKKSTPRNAERK